MQQSCPPLALAPAPTFTWLLSRTDQPERHLSTFEKQQPHKEGGTESSQEGLRRLLATVADQAIWQNCHSELSLQVTGDPPTDDVLPMRAQVRSWLCRRRASWRCWSVRGSGLWGDQPGCRSAKPWGSQAVVSQAWGGQAAGCHQQGCGVAKPWSVRRASAQSVTVGLQGRRGSRWPSPAPQARARDHRPRPQPRRQRRCHSWATRSSAT